jgi:FAD/FMN-containing dehydrogenase
LAATHSPAGNRDARFNLNVTASWEDAGEDKTHIAWARAAWSDMRRHSTGGTYLNFLTEKEGADRILAAYGKQNFPRLQAIKARYDPDNLFRHNKNIAPKR